MAKCPNCGYHLKLTDWRPECPKCGVNLLYFKMEDRLREDADKAELEYAKSQPRIDRLKASIYGSPLAIVRLVCTLLPLLALLLPLGHITISVPFYEHSTTVNAIAVYQMISSLDLNMLLSLAKSELMGTYVIFFILAVVFLLLAVVLILLEFIFIIMSFGKKWFPRNMIVASIGIVLVVLSSVFFSLSCNGFSAVFPGYFSGGLGLWGVAAEIITFLLVILVNVLIKVKKIEVKYTDVSEYYLPYHERPSVIAAEKAAREAALAKENAGQTAPATE